MIARLLTEQVNPESSDIDARSTLEILTIINEQDRHVIPAVAAEIPQLAKLVDAAVNALQNDGRLFYIGAGTSGRLGVLDAAECPPTFSVSSATVQGIIAGGEAALARATEATEDDPAQGRRDLLERGFLRSDILVGIAASGRTPYVLGAVAAARELGAVTGGISCSPDSDLARAVDIAVTPLPGPEVIAGSTRMRAGTATKLVLNMLSTAVMIRLGYVYGNLMVNVQPKNEKLVDRAKRIIAEATGLSIQQAGALLESSGRDVKTAIVMGRLGVGAAAARERLAAARGHVRQALAN
ncbi:MAG: N-acetylmuramic acid 6-phosphate etherase [Acidobacteriota bacterium]|nr:N-acetylmuramic acid 6-phosphate etherase [Acidobacteriota bacterium]